jgi:hypothetical protein
MVQIAALRLLDPSPRALTQYTLTIGFSVILVTIGVFVFGAVKDLATDVVKTFRRIAFVTLLISLMPDLALGMGWFIRGERWTLAIVYSVMHVVAWFATVDILTRFGVDPEGNSSGA